MSADRPARRGTSLTGSESARGEKKWSRGSVDPLNLPIFPVCYSSSTAPRQLVEPALIGLSVTWNPEPRLVILVTRCNSKPASRLSLPSQRDEQALCQDSASSLDAGKDTITQVVTVEIYVGEAGPFFANTALCIRQMEGRCCTMQRTAAGILFDSERKNR